MTRPSKSLPTAAPPPPQQMVAAESDMVVILSALLCALICAAGLAAVIRCAWLRTRFTGSSNSSSSSSNKGLKRKALQSLPKSIFTIADKSNSDECECAICLNDFNDGEEIRVLPLCNHSFHLICIDKWLSSKSSCPSCRRRILAPVRCDRCGYSLTLPRHQHHRREDMSRSNSAEFLP